MCIHYTIQTKAVAERSLCMTYAIIVDVVEKRLIKKRFGNACDSLVFNS